MKQLISLLCMYVIVILQVTAQESIAITTSKEAGDSIKIKVLGTNLWIDLNNNGTQDEHESIHAKTAQIYYLSSSSIVVYGDSITYFSCASNKITSIDLEYAPHLEELACNGNSISQIDISTNVLLTNINLSSNKLTELDISHNTLLESLTVYGNNLTELHTSGNIHLTLLNCGVNKLTALDLQYNTALTDLRCYKNLLTDLDISHNQLLTNIKANDNKFESCALLDIYSQLPVNESDKVYSIEVKTNPGAGTSNTGLAEQKGWTIDVVGDNTGCVAPEPLPASRIRFATELSVGEEFTVQAEFASNAWIDVNNNGVQDTGEQLVSASKQTFTVASSLVTLYGDVSYLDLSSAKLSSIAFESVDVRYLHLSENPLSTLDVSMLQNLKELHILNTELQTIDLSHNIDLEQIIANELEATNLDLSNNINLQLVEITHSQLESIELSAVAPISYINIADNRLDACALQDIFTVLPQAESSDYNAYIAGNPGAASSNTALLSQKGWEQIDVLGDNTGCIEQNTNTSVAGLNSGITITYNNAVVYVHLPQHFIGKRAQLYTTMGQQVLQFRIHSAVEQISLADYPAGVYILHITDNERIIRAKIVK